MPDGRTAILFFSHRPAREWHNKRFVEAGYVKNRRVAAAFYEHARKAVAKSALPVLEAHGPQQRGDTFGARLANAFADAFAAGYDRVIAVGSDCPTLHEVDWAAVEARLADGTPVLGPTANGAGTYLIGLTRAQFDWTTFATLPWQSPTLLAALHHHLASDIGTTPALRPPRADVNGHADLVHLVRRAPAPPRGLVDRLRAVLGGISTAGSPTTAPASPRTALRRRPRAPPAPPRSPCA